VQPGYEDEDEDDRIPLNPGDDEAGWDDEPDLGPDERDLDLMDGTWEQKYYAGRRKSPDWGAITIGLGLLVLISLLLPMILVVLR
jgi:hypothetical protein